MEELWGVALRSGKNNADSFLKQKRIIQGVEWLGENEHVQKEGQYSLSRDCLEKENKGA